MVRSTFDDYRDCRTPWYEAMDSEVGIRYKQVDKQSDVKRRTRPSSTLGNIHWSRSSFGPLGFDTGATMHKFSKFFLLSATAASVCIAPIASAHDVGDEHDAIHDQ